MIQCSTSNVMYPRSVSDLQQVWEHFYFPAVPRKETCASERRDHDPSAVRRSKRSGDRDPDCSREYLKGRKKRLNEILAANTGKPYDVIAADTERDYYMSAEEAKAYGLIDDVITNR